MPVPTIYSTFCLLALCRPEDNLRVTTFKPTAGTSISHHVNKMVVLE